MVTRLGFVQNSAKMHMSREISHDLDWQDLRHFAAFARARTLSGAAKQLAVDHVTVARRIAALETAIGARLLDRRPRIPVLTVEGERVAASVLAMESSAEAVARTARGLAPELGGSVSVTAPPTLINALIAPNLGKLRARHPELALQLVGEKRIASLGRREADVALRLVRPSEPELVAKRLGAFAFRLYGHRAYLARTRPRDHEFIAFDASGDHLPQQSWLLRHAGARRIALRTNDLESQLAAALAQVGIVALPFYVAARHPVLVPVATRLRPITRELWLAVHEDLRAVASVRAVMEFVTECTAGLAQG